MLLNVISKLYEIEEERSSVGNSASSRNSLNQAYNQSMTQHSSSASSSLYNNQNKNTSEFLVFKNTSTAREVAQH